MENEEREITEETPLEEKPIEATFEGENANPVKPKRTKKEIRTLTIVACIYGALVAITAAVLIIGANSSSTTTTPTTHLSGTGAGYYDKDKKLISSFSIDDVSLQMSDGFYSISSINSKEGTNYVVLPSSYNGTRIMYTGDVEEGKNIFGKDSNSDAIEEIYFPNLYWTVGANSFSAMNSLTRISLAGASEGRLTISQGAFKDCPLLTNVELPKNLFALGENAFANCTSLTSIDYKGTVLNFKEVTDYAKAFTGEVTIYCTDGNIKIPAKTN